MKKNLFTIIFLSNSYLFSQITITIEPNKINDVAPFKLYVDATKTEDPEINKSIGKDFNFHNLHFEWDFGDNSDAKWVQSGKKKNVGYGAISGHVYDTPGTYDIMLYVSNPITGEKTSKSFEITVTNPDEIFPGENTICFSTSGDFSGAPEGALQIVTSDYKEVFDTYAKTGKRLLFKRGEVWKPSATPARILDNGPGIIGAFGVGPKPKLMPVSGVNRVITTSSTTHNTTSNWRIMDLEIDGSENTYSYGIELGGQDMLLYRVDLHDLDAGVSFGTSGLDYQVHNNAATPILHSDIGIIECSINDIGNPLISGGGVGIFGASDKLLILGNEMIDNTNGEHNIRLTFHIKAIISHNFISQPARTKQVLTLRSGDFEKEDGVLKGKGSSRRTIVSDNHFYADETFIMSNSGVGNNGGDYPKGFDLILERNFIESDGIVTGPFVLYSFRNTVRNNIFSNNFGGLGINKLIADYDEKMNTKIYNNSFYSKNSGPNIFFALNKVPLEGCEVYNNLFIGDPTDRINKIRLNPETIDALISNNIETLEPRTVSESYKEANDFNLLGDSPLIDKGTETPNPIDFFCNERNISTMDIGAIEYSSEVLNVKEEIIDNVQIYPNPTKNDLYLSNLKELKSKALIYSITGRLILEKEIENTSTHISTSKLNNGIYLLVLNGNTYKFIKNN